VKLVNKTNPTEKSVASLLTLFGCYYKPLSFLLHLLAVLLRLWS